MSITTTTTEAMTMELRTNEEIDARISKAFRAAFEAHPARHTDPAVALDSARGDASDLVPKGITGTFDDETLTFRAD